MIPLLAQESIWSSNVGLAIIAGLAIIGFVLFIIVLKFGLIWIQARVSNAPVGLFEMVFMSLRKVPPKLMVNARIMSVKAGIPVATDMLEAHFLAKGNVVRVIHALISASKAKISH